MSRIQTNQYPYPALHSASALSEQFPGFGKIARETFVLLPAVVCLKLKAQEDPAEIRRWTYDLLDSWGEWVQRGGFIPHELETSPERTVARWDSADSTLWFCHALAALWVLSLDEGAHEVFPDFEQRFEGILGRATRSIRDGFHPCLRRNISGLLEISESQSSWLGEKTGMNAELNALWFQMRLLNFLWRGEEGLYDLELLGREVLRLAEENRTSSLFTEGLPLSPAAILKDWSSLRSDLRTLGSRIVQHKLLEDQIACTWPTDTPPERRRKLGARPTRSLTRLWLKDFEQAG